MGRLRADWIPAYAGMTDMGRLRARMDSGLRRNDSSGAHPLGAGTFVGGDVVL